MPLAIEAQCTYVNSMVTSPDRRCHRFEYARFCRTGGDCLTRRSPRTHHSHVLRERSPSRGPFATPRHRPGRGRGQEEVRASGGIPFESLGYIRWHLDSKLPCGTPKFFLSIILFNGFATPVSELWVLELLYLCRAEPPCGSQQPL